MNQQETLEKLKAIVKPFVKNQEAFQNLSEDTDFINDLQINSANLVDIVLDNETYSSGIKQGNKKRNTVIQFIPTISNEAFNKKTEWLYLLVMNGRIVKIGGTRTGIRGRIASYLCGHHIEERGKSGDCSKTNAYIYNTFAFYLQLGCKIQMYGYELPKTEMTIEIFGKETKITAQTYHAYESTFLEDYKKNYNEYPILSDNCDPDYKS
jgi:acyl carrier protein